MGELLCSPYVFAKGARNRGKQIKERKREKNKKEENEELEIRE